jgi:hypothetical protein
MTHCSIDHLALAKYFPWKRTRLYQLAKNHPEVLQKFGCKVLRLNNRIVIEVHNKELEERVLRIKQLLGAIKRKRPQQRKPYQKITVMLTPPKLVLFNSLKPAFVTFLDSLDEDSDLPIKVSKKNIYLNDKHFALIKKLAQKYHMPATTTLEGIIEVFLLNLSSKINRQNLRQETA